MTTEPTTKSKARVQYINKDGEKVPGVTTVLSVLAKPALITWANKLGLQGIDSNKYVDELAEIGHVAHYLILCHLTGDKPQLDDYSKNTIDRAENSFLSYLNWEKGHKVDPIIVEKPLVSDIYGYGGTPDFLGYVDDTLELMDFKTGKAIYPEYYYQLAAYRQLILEINGYKLNQCRILRIGRTEDEGFEERIARHFEIPFKIFRNCLSIYNLQKEFNKEK